MCQQLGTCLDLLHGQEWQLSPENLYQAIQMNDMLKNSCSSVIICDLCHFFLLICLNTATLDMRLLHLILIYYLVLKR